MTTKAQADTAATAKGISVLTKWKKRFFELNITEYLGFSADTPEWEVLGGLVNSKDIIDPENESEPEQEYFLPLLQRNGVNPLESAGIDCFEAYKDAKKNYWDLVDKIAEDTKITRYQVLNFASPSDMGDLQVESLEKNIIVASYSQKADETEDADLKMEYTQKVTEATKRIRELEATFQEKKKETELILAPFKDELEKAEKAKDDSTKEYEMALASLRSKISVDSLEKLHPELLSGILEFIRREINGEVSEKK